MRPPTQEELTIPIYAADYARDVIKGRWPEGEPAIASSSSTALVYAELLNSPFPAGEPAIAKDFHLSQEYLSGILRVIPSNLDNKLNRWRNVTQRWRMTVLGRNDLPYS